METYIVCFFKPADQVGFRFGWGSPGMVHCGGEDLVGSVFVTRDRCVLIPLDRLCDCFSADRGSRYEFPPTFDCLWPGSPCFSPVFGYFRSLCPFYRVNPDYLFLVCECGQPVYRFGHIHSHFPLRMNHSPWLKKIPVRTDTLTF